MRFLPLVGAFLAVVALLVWNAWKDYRERTLDFKAWETELARDRHPSNPTP